MVNQNSGRAFAFNLEKLKELILHVCLKQETDVTFGATKVNKILFYADFRAYVALGEPISGDEYQKLENGPAPRHVVPAREELERDRAAIVRSGRHYGYVQHRPVALREPNLELFGSREIAIADEVLDESKGRTASRMSEESHEFLGWKLARFGETIPYEIALITPNASLTHEERALGLSSVERARALTGDRS